MPKLRSKKAKRKTKKTTMLVSWKVRDYLEGKGKKNKDECETFDEVLRRVLKIK